MASTKPKKQSRIHKALGSLSASVLASQVSAFLQSVSTTGWAAAAATTALDPVTAGAVLATTTAFGISQACEGQTERKMAGELAKEFEKLHSQQGNALYLLNKIADGEIGVTLDWFTQEELAERITAMMSGKMDRQLAIVLKNFHLSNMIADGQIGVTLDWFTQEELAERTTAMISSKLDEQLAGVLERQQAGFAMLDSRLAELSRKLEDVKKITDSPEAP